MARKVSPAKIEKHLKGMSFPAGKQDLISCARSNDAPSVVMSVLQQMPDRQYDSAADVARGIGKVE